MNWEFELEYIDGHDVKFMMNRNDRLRVAWEYIIKDCCNLQGWRRQCEMEVKRQKSERYIEEGCTKVLWIIDYLLRLVPRNKIYYSIQDSCQM